MTVIGGSVQVGPGVIFRGNVSIQPGANVIAPHGHTHVPIPSAVPSSSSMGRREQDGVVFAKAANSICMQAGVRKPNTEMDVSESITSMSANDSGAIVVSGESVSLYNSGKKIHQLTDKDFQESV